jgi:hypothetical protein
LTRAVAARHRSPSRRSVLLRRSPSSASAGIVATDTHGGCPRDPALAARLTWKRPSPAGYDGGLKCPGQGCVMTRKETTPIREMLRTRKALACCGSRKNQARGSGAGAGKILRGSRVLRPSYNEGDSLGVSGPEMWRGTDSGWSVGGMIGPCCTPIWCATGKDRAEIRPLGPDPVQTGVGKRDRTRPQAAPAGIEPTADACFSPSSCPPSLPAILTGEPQR